MHYIAGFGLGGKRRNAEEMWKNVEKMRKKRGPGAR
jgi:hypothetical protein